jgi:hypothetical protein
MNWISVKDRLPEEWSDVIVTDGINVNAGYFGGTWKEDGGVEKSGFYEYENGIEGLITHWMPMPEPPISDIKKD